MGMAHGLVRALAIAAALLGPVPPVAAAPAGPADPDTRAWWALTSELAGDDMAGRDTGSAEYDRAAALVARRFAAAGLRPAGPGGDWFQPIDFTELRLDEARSRLTVGGIRLRFNHDLTLSPAADTPERLAGPATFRGYCGADEIADVRGQLVICYGRPAPARIGSFDRARALRGAGAAGMLLIAAPGLTGEPMRWPLAYSRSVSFAGQATPGGAPFVSGMLNPDAFARLTPRGRSILRAGAAGRDLPRLALGTVAGELALSRAAIRSANVLGLLPGTDPALADQVIVVAAHLDGYGRGEPVGADGIYNGALDDAAYVALLEQLAARRAGQGFRRPVLFAVFTAEEKGLLGSRWYVDHPTLPLASHAAVINLDQIRPLYPLKVLSVHGLVESTLGDHVRRVGRQLGIGIQEDPEPERNLLRRSDNWPFMAAGIPGTSFVFATYDAASRARYRDWYLRRYHHPADDLSTPLDWQAATDFNRFFYTLTRSVADGADAPAWHPGGRPGAN